LPKSKNHNPNSSLPVKFVATTNSKKHSPQNQSKTLPLSLSLSITLSLSIPSAINANTHPTV
jgi:hypothetical protein